ncbi:MAG TPA: hypothetical protein VG897_19360, partial [Terriglobales bacterium]|nr:hypothetical protein [Terriglobales bacterium]
MIEGSSRFLIVVVLCFCALLAFAGSETTSGIGTHRTTSDVFLLNVFSGSEAVSNGIQVRSGEAVLRVTALRDDVLRVRIGRDGVLPEDASWAVLPESRLAQVSVTAESDADSVGFRTKLLRVRIDRQTLRLSLFDLKGNVLQQDAAGWPVEFHDKAFRIYKEMPDDEHYFGLGDKVGPLDRRNQAFTMWNTDAYRFQESTDPIYKSIPFFLT